MNVKKVITIYMSFMLSVVLFLSGCSSKIDSTASAGDIIGIIGAMDVEVASIKEEMTINEKKTFAGMEYTIGTFGNANIVVVKCDMGKVNAGICASTLINQLGCTKIINTGVAGALDKKLKMGDIVISTDAVQHDFDARPIGYERGEIPYTGLVSFKADEKLIDEIYEVASEFDEHTNVYKGRVCTGDQFIASVEDLEKIVSSFGGLCCEMEGGAIAQVCYLNKTPFVIIRTISDTPGVTEISEYQEKEADFSLKCARIVEKMLRNW